VEWIKVSDRLPEIFISVLIYDKNRGRCLAQWDGEDFCDEHSWYTQVTHWSHILDIPE